MLFNILFSKTYHFLIVGDENDVLDFLWFFFTESHNNQTLLLLYIKRLIKGCVAGNKSYNCS